VARHLHASKSRLLWTFSGGESNWHFLSTITCVLSIQMDHMSPFETFMFQAFQWCKEILNPMNFDLWNYSMKIQDSIGAPTPKVGVHLGMCVFIPSHIPSHSWKCKCDYQVALLTCTLPCLCLGREPKAKVVTCHIWSFSLHIYSNGG
jgi:hypothetical protein